MDGKNVTTKVAAFFADYKMKQYEDGQILVQANDVPPGIFYLVSGNVRQYDISDNGDEVVVNVFKPGAFFPMSWAINGAPNQYFFQASSGVQAIVAPGQDVVEFLRANPDAMYDLLSRLYSGVDGVLRRMAHLMGGSARSRLLFELITECQRFATRSENGSYALQVHEDELARRAGLSRETVNRELGKLKTANLLTVSHKDLVVMSLERLKAELGEGL